MVGILKEKNNGGRPSLEITDKIKERLYDIIKQQIVCYPAQLRRIYNTGTDKSASVSWNTIKKYLEELEREKFIEKIVLNKGKRKTMCQFKVSVNNNGNTNSYV